MKKKQQDSPASETFIAADQLPAVEVLAGELLSVVARNVGSGRWLWGDCGMTCFGTTLVTILGQLWDDFDDD